MLVAASPALRPPQRPIALFVVALAHVVLLWAAIELAGRLPAAPQLPALWVSLLPEPARAAAPDLPTPLPARLSAPGVPSMPPLPAPELVLVTPQPAAAPVSVTPAPPAPESAPARHSQGTAAGAEPLPPAPPRALAIHAVRYRIEPPLQYPPEARRLQLQGEVRVRVLVDVQGAPERVLLCSRRAMRGSTRRRSPPCAPHAFIPTPRTARRFRSG